jgi:hypothetical protein
VSIRIDLRVPDGNGEILAASLGSFGGKLPIHDDVQRERTGERFQESLFGAAQPRKLGVEEGAGVGGGFARRHLSWGRRGRWGQLGAAVSLVAAVGSAATRSQEAKLLWGLIE